MGMAMVKCLTDMTFAGFLLKKVMGWKGMTPPAPSEKCIILGVPHTSMWDFVVSYLYYKDLGHTAHVMIKKQMFWGPLGWLLRKMGCIPVDRSNGASTIRSVIEQARDCDGPFHLCICPEGTRKPVARWKMGYHKIAKELGCPVYMGYFDWGKKQIGIGPEFPLTDDARADTDRLQAEYEKMGIQGKHRDNYITH